MAVVAHALPVEDRPAPLGIALSFRALVRRLGAGPGIHLKHGCELDRQQAHEKQTGKRESPENLTHRVSHRITLPIDPR